MRITRLKNPWGCKQLCWLIRIGKIKSTPEVRQVAKIVTFALVYGAPLNKELPWKERSLS